MYFSGMKIGPKYTFLLVFFLICPSCPFQICQYDQKHTISSNFAHFCTPKRCKRVHCLVLKNNPNYVIFFLWGWYPTLNTSAPPALGTCMKQYGILLALMCDISKSHLPSFLQVLTSLGEYKPGNKEAREGTARFLLRHRPERSHFNIFEHCVRCYARVVHRVLSASCVVSMQRRI